MSIKNLGIKTLLVALCLCVGSMSAWADRTTTISYPDGWGGTDFVNVVKGGTVHYKFTQTSVNNTALYYGFALVVQNTSSQDLAVVRCDNWDNTSSSNTYFDTELPSGWDASAAHYATIKEGSTVDMTVSYSAEGVFTMASTVTPTTGSAFKYNFSRSFTDTPDEIKVALFADHAILTCTRYPSDSYFVMGNGSSVHYNFTELNTMKNSWDGFILDVENASGTRVIGVRQDNYELMNTDNHWAGLTMDWDWNTINFPAVMNGATIDMTVTYSGGTFTMAATFNGSDNNTYHLNYTKALGTTDPIAVYLEEDNCKLTMNTAEYTNGDIISLPFTYNYGSTLASIDPFDKGAIQQGTNLKALRFGSGQKPATAYFDSDTNTDGRQPYAIGENEAVVFTINALHGYLGSKGNTVTATISIVNSEGKEIASYSYNTDSGNIYDVKIGGTSIEGFEAFTLRSLYQANGSANGFNGNNNKPYVTNESYNPTITIVIDGAGNVSLNFTRTQGSINQTFIGTLAANVAKDVAKLVVDDGITNTDRAYAIRSLTIESKPSYVVKAVDGEGNVLTTLDMGTLPTEGTITKYWSKYIKVGDNWYVTNSPYGKELNENANTAAPVYTLSNIDFFVEVENMTGYSAVAESTGTDYSGGISGRPAANKSWYSDAIEEGGSYTIGYYHHYPKSNNASPWKFYSRTSEGTTTLISAESVTGNNLSTISNANIPTGSSIQISNEETYNFNHEIDYITLTKTYVDYTLKYVNGANSEELTTVTRQAKWGSAITIDEADKQVTVEDVTYGYVSDDITESTVVAADGSTVVTISVTTPCEDPTYVLSAAGTDRKFTLASATEGATLYYSETEKTAQDEGWLEYTGEVTTSATTIWAYAAKSGYANSAVISFATGVGETVALNAPTINRTSANTVTITASQTGVLGTPTATIYYRLGESGEFSTYSSSLNITAATTVYAYAQAAGYDNSTNASREVDFIGNLTTVEDVTEIRGYSTGGLDKDNGVEVSEISYYPLVIDGNRWGSNIYFQDEAGWGFRSNNTWYNGSAASAKGWLMIRGLQKGNIVVIKIQEKAVGTSNATYQEKYSYDGYYAYTVDADGDFQLKFNRKADKGNNVLTGIVAYSNNLNATISAAGWATLYTDYALDFDGTGLTAYTASYDDSKVTLTEVQNVPAGTGVVLKGDANTYSIPVIASSETAKGQLTGSTTEGLVYSAEAADDYYMLTLNSEGKAQFTKLTSGTIAAGKAYLPIAKAANGARLLSVVFADDATGISSVPVADDGMATDAPVYNLKGQRVSQPQKGLYIVNGKKMVIK